jgi:hypothetical protein
MLPGGASPGPAREAACMDNGEYSIPKTIPCEQLGLGACCRNRVDIASFMARDGIQLMKGKPVGRAQPGGIQYPCTKEKGLPQPGAARAIAEK